MPGACRLGHMAEAQADAHGCIACPHHVKGPATTGSPDVKINNMPALRVTDMGVHAPCCGPNMWSAGKGSGTVTINFLPAVREGDMTQHCGGVGQMVEGSQDVIIGD